MTLKKTNATLDELTAHQASLKTQIRELQKQEKTVKGTIKSIQKLTLQMPGSEPRSRSKKTRVAAAATA